MTIAPHSGGPTAKGGGNRKSRDPVLRGQGGLILGGERHSPDEREADARLSTRRSVTGNGLQLQQLLNGSRARLLPRPPKPRHRLVQRRRVAVRHAWFRRHDRGDGPEPAQLRRRAEVSILVDATDDLAIGQHVIVLVLPLAKGAEGAGAL
jgi:hypothetical protein